MAEPVRDAVPQGEPVMTAGERIGFLALTAAGLAAIGWLAVTWLRLGWGEHPVAWLVASAILAVTLVNNQGRWSLLLAMRRPVRRPPPPGLRVAIVTTCVPSVEPLEMIESSLTAMRAVRYPHDTWLLDEGNDPAVRELCARLGVHHFSRKEMAEYQAPSGSFQRRTKHGNYNAWLREVGFGRYDYLIAFDPDHLPLPEYADEVLGYFDDPAVGYVQPAQAFYNQPASLVARAAAEETYAYFSSVQMAAYAMGYPIIVGSHNVHRMAALRDVEGLAPHDADDLMLTLRYRSARWSGVYVPRILARGLAPVDWRSYLVQQRRWARSVLDIKLRKWDAYSDHLPLRSRVMSFLHGINFLHRAAVFAGILALVLYLLATASTLPMLTAPIIAPAVAVVVILLAQEAMRQRYYLGADERGTHWRVALVEYAKWPWFVLALWDVLASRAIPYTITRKTPQGQAFTKVIALNVMLALLVVLAWLVGRTHGEPSHAVMAAGALHVALSAAVIVAAIRRPPPPFTRGMWHPAPAMRLDPHPAVPAER